MPEKAEEVVHSSSFERGSARTRQLLGRAALAGAALMLSSAMAVAGCNSGNAANTDLLSSSNCQANASGSSATAVGAGAIAGDHGGSAFGAGASAANIASTALGFSAKSSAQRSTALGDSATAAGRGATAVGWSAGFLADADGATMVGQLAGADGAGTYSIAIGAGQNFDAAPNALGPASIAIGGGTTEAGGASAEGVAAVAIGNRSQASVLSLRVGQFARDGTFLIMIAARRITNPARRKR